MADPPVDPGAVNATDAWLLPAVAAPIVGIPGTVAGVTDADAVDATLLPAVLPAVTVNV